MREQVSRLQKLTTDLLDLSRLDAGSLEVRLEAVPLLSVAQSVAEEFFPAAAVKGADDRRPRTRTRRPTSRRSATLSEPPRSSASCSTTRCATRPSGTSITIEATAPGTAPRGAARLSVIDAGPGIDPGELALRLRPLPHRELGRRLRTGARDRPPAGPPDGGHAGGRSEPGRTVFTLSLPLAGARPARVPAAHRPNRCTARRGATDEAPAGRGGAERVVRRR